MSQIDLVPTVSLMLGIPVPYSNLGTVISDLFGYDPLRLNSSLNRMHYKLSALQLNAQQVQLFLRAYANQSNDLPQLKLSKLDEDFILAERQLKELFREMVSSKNVSDQALAAVAKKYIDYLGAVCSLCRSIWSKFDLDTMTVGIVVLICAFLFNITMATCETNCAQLSTVLFIAASITGLSGVANLLQLLPSGLTLLFTIFSIAFFLMAIFVMIGKHIFSCLSPCVSRFQFLDTFSILLCCMHSVSLLSNSFTVYEDRSTLFIVQSLLVAILLAQISVISYPRPSVIDHTSKRRLPKEFSWTSVHIMLLVAALAGCIRFSTLFRSCREEQADCEISWFAQPVSAILTEYEHFRLARLSVSLVSVVVVVAVVTMWLRHCGNMNGLEPSVVALRYIVPLTSVCLCIYWCVDGFLLQRSAIRLIHAGVTALPRLVYALSFATVIVVTVSPLSLFMVHLQQNSTAEEQRLEQLQNVSREELIAQIYGHIRKNWRSVLTSPDASRPPDNTPVVYGLATVYSSGQIVLLTAVAMVLMLVLGDNMAPTIALWMISEILLLELHAAYSHQWSGEGKSCMSCQIYPHLLYVFQR